MSQITLQKWNDYNDNHYDLNVVLVAIIGAITRLTNQLVKSPQRVWKSEIFPVFHKAFPNFANCFVNFRNQNLL